MKEMNRTKKRLIVMCGLLAGAIGVALAAPTKADDPTGILRKPLPDKLVVLTFDDGCVSHSTTVAPLLKELGFGATFYICDGFSFNTRKDWYLTWRQIKAMAADGFEIGNHSYGHCGGADINNWLSMEDRLLAHDCPKTTTVCWPVYQVNISAYPDLAANGYTFGRGGHERPYRPTVDNPFDVPSFTIGDHIGTNLTPEYFVNKARQAVGGKIVVFCYHGIPDGEHPGVGLDPTIFKAQMRYLKDNNYKVVSLCGLTEYIDPAKAAKLPPTAGEIKESAPPSLAKEDKPFVSAGIVEHKLDAVSMVKPPAKPAPTAAPTIASPQGRVMRFDKPGNNTFSEPTELASDVTVDVIGNGEVKLPGLISGPGRLIKQGDGRLTITNLSNTYSGGTVINGGTLMMFVLAREGLGSGPITLNGGATLALELIHGTNPLILNGGTIYAGNSTDSWNGPITLNGNVDLSIFGEFDLNKKSGGISGPGSLNLIGGGTAIFSGSNTYSGPTNISQGRLIVRNAASLYHADPTSWTPDRISVSNTAALQLGIDGKDGFTPAQVSTLLKNLTKKVDHNGLMKGSIFGLDTSEATGIQEFSAPIADSKGPGGGAFTFKKCGAGTLRLTRANTYTGRTILEGGTLSVASINRVVGGRAGSSLGAPATLETGIIGFGGDCTLSYTGKGEVTDRVIDLTGDNQTPTLDQSGTGLLKFTSPFDISGYGHPKTIQLTGSSTGTGELSATLANPYDRKKKAVLAITKNGTGTWILSGANTYTGPTTVTQGTLVLANSKSLAAGTEVAVAPGAQLDLKFKGEMKISKLTLGGVVQPAATYSAANSPEFIRGTGILKN